MSDNEDVKCGWKTRADELSASLVQVAQQRDAARADAARLREALETAVGLMPAGFLNSNYANWHSDASAALAATSSAEWLAKHDAEVRAPLERRIAELERSPEQDDWDHIEAQVKSLKKQLVAATNDAARAELRVQRLRIALRTFLDFAEGEGFHAAEMRRFFGPNNIKDWRYEFAAAPDSDARLREVMLRVAEWVHEVVLSAPEPVIKSELPEIVEEVLRGDT